MFRVEHELPRMAVHMYGQTDTHTLDSQTETRTDMSTVNKLQL